MINLKILYNVFSVFFFANRLTSFWIAPQTEWVRQTSVIRQSMGSMNKLFLIIINIVTKRWHTHDIQRPISQHFSYCQFASLWYKIQRCVIDSHQLVRIQCSASLFRVSTQWNVMYPLLALGCYTLLMNNGLNSDWALTSFIHIRADSC